jgi:hypothetical protein
MACEKNGPHAAIGWVMFRRQFFYSAERHQRRQLSLPYPQNPEKDWCDSDRQRHDSVVFDRTKNDDRFASSAEPSCRSGP